MKSLLDYTDGYDRMPRKDTSSPRNSTFTFDPFFPNTGPRNPSEVNENLKLKRGLKSAVEKIYAPQSLIDSIKNSIRR